MNELMKRITNIVMLLAMSLMAMAQEQMPQSELPCDWWMEGYPEHFCDCRAGTPFQFPLQVELTDTMWFSSTVQDLKLGLSAYWLASTALLHRSPPSAAWPADW